MRALLALLCVLTFTAPAHAECAWVLWLEHSYLGTGWKMLEAVPDRATCYERKASAERGPRPQQFYPETTLRYICAPDSVDPRGPKGK